MITIKIKAGDLDRLIQNALLFTDEKAIRLHQVLFVIENDKLQIFSIDDFVSVTDSCDVVDQVPQVFALTIADVDYLGEWVKKDKKVVHKYDIIIQPKFTGMLFECEETSPEDESDNIFFNYDPVDEEAWDLVEQLLDVNLENHPIESFAVRGERVSKLWRLKADKEAPIDFRIVNINSWLIVQFMKGDTLRGAIMPIRREMVREEFLWPIVA